MHFLYRTKRLKWDLRTTERVDVRQIVERGRRRWRIKADDRLVFTEGKGLELTFVATAVVEEVRTVEEEGTDPVQQVVTATVAFPTFLREGLTLSRMMYSLTAVANFRRPWLHLKHRTRLRSDDVYTLQEQRIAWDRTVYFALLHDLPSVWREFLEAQSHAEYAAKKLEAESQWESQSRFHSQVPVQELLALVESTLLVPARIAAQIHSRWISALPTDDLLSIDVIGANGSEPWKLGRLLSAAHRQWEQLETGWEATHNLSEIENTTVEDLKWRPHHW